jgi:hypothetical protein
MRKRAKVFFCVRPLEAYSLQTKHENEAHEDVEARSYRGGSGRNPGDGGERAVALLADIPRAYD